MRPAVLPDSDAPAGPSSLGRAAIFLDSAGPEGPSTLGRPAVFLDSDPPEGASSLGRPAVFLDSDERPRSSSLGRPAVFLDRDGVLNRRKLNLVRTLDQLRILPGVGASVARFTQAGYAVVLATNQEWVGQGYIRHEEHEAIMAAIVDACQEEGGKVDGVYACLHPKTQDCHDRKPKPGMLTDAARDLGLDLRRSFMVGDNAKDMKAGRAAGATTILVDPRLRTWVQRAHLHADRVARDLLEAADWILDHPR